MQGALNSHVDGTRGVPRALLVFSIAVLTLAVIAGAASAGKGKGKGKGGKAPDLVIKKVTGLPQSAVPGQKIKLKATVKNVGKAKAKKSKLSFRLSDDRKPSRSDLSVGSKTRVRTLKPNKKVKIGVTLRVPAGAAGPLHLITCASKAKGEKGSKNNCKVLPRPISFPPPGPSGPVTPPTGPTDPPPGPGDPPPVDPPPFDTAFPERFIGTSTATTVRETTTTGTGNLCGDRLPSYDRLTATSTTEVTFERFGTAGNYSYETTGEELRWTIDGRDNSGTRAGAICGAPTETNETTSCTSQGSGEVPIGRPSETRYASGRIVRNGSSLAPGSAYYFLDTWDFAGFGSGGPLTTVEYTTACSRVSNDGVDYSGTYMVRFQPDVWFPTSTCNNPSAPGNNVYTVRDNGSLSGTDSCNYSATGLTADGREMITRTNSGSWTWNMTPAGPETD